MRSTPRDSIARPLLLTLLVVAVLAQGVFSAFYLVPWEDESGYLVVGTLAVRGKIRLYQDEMLGERLPGPFYMLGATQLATGPSLLAARLFSLVLGLTTVVLVYALGRRIGGDTCGTLGALFLGTQSMLIGYYATAMYHAVCSLAVVFGLYLIFAMRSPLAGMASFSLLSLIRPNMAVMVPLVLGFLFLRTRGWRARLLLVAVSILPPVAFFISGRDHLKLLAYVPVLHDWVRPLGYVSLFRLGGEMLAGEASWPAGMFWFGRRYVVWLVTGAGLLAMTVLARSRGRALAAPGSREMRFVAVLLAYTLAWQCVILSHYPKSVAAWTASFAVLGALVMGYHAARLLDDRRLPSIGRGLVAFGLLAAFALGPMLSTHANMPRPLPIANTTIGALDEGARKVRDAIPAKSRVFLAGMSILAYLADVRPYPQQLIHSWTLVPNGEPAVLSRSGLWGPGDIETWLGSEAPFAILQENRMSAWRANEAYRPLAVRIDELIQSRFEQIAEVNEYPLGLYRVYGRRKNVRSGEGPS